MNKKQFGLTLVLVLANAQAGDIKRELDYADEIANTLKTGEIIHLEAAGNEFLALYMEAERADQEGTAIILHDKGGHPNQKPLIHQLRTQLPKHRWSTLALQLPLREAGADTEDYYALFPEAEARIQATVDYLVKSEARNIALIGYGLGGLMALFVQNRQPEQFQAIAAISLPVPETDNPSAQTLVFMTHCKIPLLDIYGALDNSDVTDNALKKRMAGKNNEAYRQVKINDQDHLYRHDEGLMVKRIYSWLRRMNLQQPE